MKRVPPIRLASIISHGNEATNETQTGTNFVATNNQAVQDVSSVSLKYVSFCNMQNLLQPGENTFTIDLQYRDVDRDRVYTPTITVSLPVCIFRAASETPSCRDIVSFPETGELLSFLSFLGLNTYIWGFPHPETAR